MPSFLRDPSFPAVARRVAALALPVIAANLLQSLVNVVDVFMAGRLGPVEIAAVGLATTVRMLVFILVLSVTAGAQALAAQARGARDPARLAHVARQTLSLSLAVAAVLGAVGFVAAGPALAFLNAGGQPEATALGASYLRILFLGTVFLLGNFAVNSLLQGAGDTVTPLWLSGIVNVLNVGLNALLIFGPGPLPALGVPGAALGTVIARALGLAAGVAVLRSGRKVVTLGRGGSYRPDPATFRAILAIGIPSGLQGLVRNTAQLAVVRIVTSTAVGTYGVAAMAIGLQAESLAFMPGLAIGVAATSLVGRGLGAWQVADARRAGHAALALGVLVMTPIAGLLLAFAPRIVLLFDPSAHPLVLEAGTSYLRINALSHPLLALAMVGSGALRGAGDTRPALIGTLVGRWGVVAPLGWLLALPLGMGVEGVWWAMALGTAVQAAWVVARWRGGRWVGVALRGTDLWRRHLAALGASDVRRFLDGVRAPVLRSEAALERVTDEGAEYLLDAPAGARVRVRLRGGVEVVEGREHLDHLAPVARAQAAARAASQSR